MIGDYFKLALFLLPTVLRSVLICSLVVGCSTQPKTLQTESAKIVESFAVLDKHNAQNLIKIKDISQQAKRLQMWELVAKSNIVLCQRITSEPPKYEACNAVKAAQYLVDDTGVLFDIYLTLYGVFDDQRALENAMALKLNQSQKVRLALAQGMLPEVVNESDLMPIDRAQLFYIRGKQNQNIETIEYAAELFTSLDMVQHAADAYFLSAQLYVKQNDAKQDRSTHTDVERALANAAKSYFLLQSIKNTEAQRHVKDWMYELEESQ